MTDLTAVLPGFPTDQYVRLLPSIEKNKITTADLLTLDCVEIAKRASVPLLDVKSLSAAIVEALRTVLGVSEQQQNVGNAGRSSLRRTGNELLQSWHTVSTLDARLDKALGGGLPIGYITEITGESGAGKTQFLLHLLLSAQLPPPHGLSSPTLYISTESALPTTRLSQLLSHPPLVSASPKPSLDKVISIVTPDLESQDHILRYQVPVAIRKYGIRLLVLDSVAANYRAEFERFKNVGVEGNEKTKPGANMAQRSAELVKLGQLLRDLAREHNIAVVVANQVADRFSSHEGGGHASPLASRNQGTQNSSPLAQRSRGALPSSSIPGPPSSVPIPTSTPLGMTYDPMSLDHQQRFFTGWGDDPDPSALSSQSLKTPSLGLIWTTQIACRVALIKSPVYGEGEPGDEEEGGRREMALKGWRRWMKVVFAPHVAGSGMGAKGAVEFEIRGPGIASLPEEEEEGNEK